MMCFIPQTLDEWMGPIEHPYPNICSYFQDSNIGHFFLQMIICIYRQCTAYVLRCLHWKRLVGSIYINSFIEVIVYLIWYFMLHINYREIPTTPYQNSVIGLQLWKVNICQVTSESPLIGAAFVHVWLMIVWIPTPNNN